MLTYEKHRGGSYSSVCAVYHCHFLSPSPLIHHSLSPITFLFTLFCTHQKRHRFYFHSIPHSLRKTSAGWGEEAHLLTRLALPPLCVPRAAEPNPLPIANTVTPKRHGLVYLGHPVG